MCLTRQDLCLICSQFFSFKNSSWSCAPSLHTTHLTPSRLSSFFSCFVFLSRILQTMICQLDVKPRTFLFTVSRCQCFEETGKVVDIAVLKGLSPVAAYDTKTLLPKGCTIGKLDDYFVSVALFRLTIALCEENIQSRSLNSPFGAGLASVRSSS